MKEARELQERDRVQIVPIAKIAAAAVVVFVLALLGSSRLLAMSGPRERTGASPEIAPRAIGSLEQPPIESPLTAPRDGTGIARRRADEAALARYRIVDRDAGIAEIPIDRAIEIVSGAAR